MTNRQAIGFVLGLAGVWLMWHAGVGMHLYLQSTDGARSFQEALFQKDNALRLLTALAAFVGGLAALVEKQGGAWLTGICSFIFGMLTFGLIANRGDIASWRTEAVFLVIVTGLFLAYVVARKESTERELIEIENREREEMLAADRKARALAEGVTGS